MKIIDYIELGGLVKTASGHWVDAYLSDDDKYPIYGSIIDFGSKDHCMDCKWDENGLPENLPTNHGLDLNPVVEEVIYHTIKRNRLSDYDCIYDFQDQELEKKKIVSF